MKPDEAFLNEVEIVYHEELLSPTEDSIRRFEDLLNQALEDERDDRCAALLAALHDLRPQDQGLQAKTLELEGRFYAKRQKYELAERRLRKAQGIRPLGSTATATAIDISYTLSRCLRLKGSYREALQELTRLKEVVDNDPVASYLATWHQSLVYKMLDETHKALDLCEGEARQKLAEARKARSSKGRSRHFRLDHPERTEAHLDRHAADLFRQRGDYVSAHSRVQRSLSAYGNHPETEAVAHARLIRAQILRLEGLPDEAHVDAEWARQCFLTLGRRHGELMAISILGRIELAREESDAWEHFETLIAQPRWVFPSGPARGHLGLGELYRRSDRNRDATNHFEQAIAASGSDQSVVALEARTGRAAVACVTNRAAAAHREASSVAASATARANPLVRFYAQLVIAQADPTRSKAAYAQARRILDGFSRREIDRRVDDSQLQELKAIGLMSGLRLAQL